MNVRNLKEIYGCFMDGYDQDMNVAKKRSLST